MRSSRRLLAASTLALSLVAGFAPVSFAAGAAEPVAAAAGNDETVATVNGKPIKLSDIALADEEMGQALASLPEEKRFQYLLSMLIDRRIVAEAAAAKKMQDDPMVKRREAYFDEKVMRDVYWLQLMRDRVSEKAVKAYYDDNIAKAEAPTEAHAAHILVGTKAEADKIEAEIKAGKSFEDEAKAMSKDSSAANGGDLGWFKKDDMVPEFGDAVFALKPGQISAPVQTQFGWHVIKLIATRKAAKPTFEQAHDGIMRTLVRSEGNKVMEDLRKGAKIEIVGTDNAQVQMVPAP
jgi:peptidyl-prolyl cis-trans isomerase C